MRKSVFEGSNVLITGAASGIGKAVAWEMARRGATPILVDINQEALIREDKNLRLAGYPSYYFQVDVTQVEQVRCLEERLNQEGMLPDILVNCAGLTLVAHVTATQHEDWERIIGVNLMGAIHTIECFLPGMLERGRGHIVNIGSLDGLIPVPSQAAYCASKFGLTGLTEALYYDLKQYGIGVSLICPGAVDTPMSRSKPIRDMPLDFKGAGLVEWLADKFYNTPEKIARQVAEAVAYGRFLVIPGLPSRVIYHFRRLFPRLACGCGLVTARVFALLRRRRMATAT